MENIFKNIPFLRIILAFVCGIIVSAHFSIPSNISVSISVAAVLLLIVIHQRYSYRLSNLFGYLVFLLFFSLGISSYTIHNYPPEFHKTRVLIVTLTESPQVKTNSYKALAKIHSVKKESNWISTNEKIILYFEKADSVVKLQPGDQLIIKSTPGFIKNNGNPYEFNYKKYLQRKLIYRQAYLRKENWKVLNSKNKSVLIHAELIRNKLLNIYQSQKLGMKQTEILSALTLGYKSNLERDTKTVFSNAGAMHVLAVSGLHVGIVYLIFTFFFGFLRKRKGGKIIFVLLSISLLWLYAVITGLSPSVLRASTMFSLVIIATNLNRRANIYNSLAASALFLLLLSPNNLFEVGFQLSYSAVFGIVFLQPRMASIWPVKNKILKFGWDLCTVSIAAQIATFPLSAFYFNQFPTYFLFSNFIVIPAAIILIPLGMGLLLFAQIPLIGKLIAFNIKWIITIVYSSLKFIQDLPHSTFTISFHPTDFAIFLIFFISFLFFVQGKRAKSLIICCGSLFLFLLLMLSFNLKQLSGREIIVLNNKEPILYLAAGRNAYVISEKEIATDSYISNSINKIQQIERRSSTIYLTTIQDFSDDFLHIKNGLILFEGKRIALKAPSKKNIFRPDIVFLNSDKDINNLENSIGIKFSSNNHIKLPDNIHLLSQHGALHLKWYTNTLYFNLFTSSSPIKNTN